MTIICFKGRIDAESHKEAAAMIWRLHPRHWKMYIKGPMPDGRWEWTVLKQEIKHGGNGYGRSTYGHQKS